VRARGRAGVGGGGAGERAEGALTFALGPVLVARRIRFSHISCGTGQVV